MQYNKVTKEEIKQKFIKHNSYFIGVSSKPLADDVILNMISTIPLSHNIKLRTGKVQSNGIIFSDGSVLELKDNQYNKYKVFQYDDSNIYVVHQLSDSGTYGIMSKYLYYYIF